MVGGRGVLRAAAAGVACASVLWCASPALGASSLSGTVTGPSNAPLAQVCVQAVSVPPGLPTVDATTSASGTFTLAGLAAGTYRVSFKDCSGQGDYATEYYTNAIGWLTATEITVDGTANQSGVDAQLALGGKIAGTVKGPTGVPLVGICVVSTSYLGASDGGTTVTDDQGHYVIGGLQPGGYRIGLSL